MILKQKKKNLKKCFVDPISIKNELLNDSKFNDTLSSLINVTFEIPCKGENWKLCILFIKIINQIPSISDFFLQNIINKIDSYKISFQLFCENCSNLQQLIFIMLLLSKINLSKRKNYFGNKLYQILNPKFNNDWHSQEKILLYVLKIQQKSGSINPIFKPTNVYYKYSETGLNNDLEINNNNWFSFIQFVRDKMYLWSNFGLCVEFYRPSIYTFKNLKEEIIFQLQNETSINLINNSNNSDQFQKDLKKIKYLQIIFDNNSFRDEFFTFCKKRQKISQSIGIISLNYLDIEEEHDPNVPEGSNGDNSEIITSLPEVINKMIDDGKELNVPKINQVFSKPSTQLATPDDSDQRDNLDEWKIDETPVEVQSMIIPKQRNAEDVTVSKVKSTRIEVENTTDISKKIEEDKNPEDLPLIPNNSSLEITKFETNITNHKIQKAEKRVAAVNKKTEVINNNKKNISILNNIFKVDAKKPNKRLKNKVIKKRIKAPRQAKLSNVQQIITIPSQDINSKDAKSIPSNIDKKYDGPVLRTRALKKVNAVSCAKETKPIKTSINVPITKQKDNNSIHISPVITSDSKEDLVFETGNNNVLNVNDVSEQNHSKDDKDKMNILQESTTIINTTPSNLLTAQICNTSLFDTQNFTNELQAQINRSVLTFSNELTRKLDIINDEMNNRILKDLSTKYQGLIEEFQTKFQNDTEKIFQFISNFQHLLLLPEDELKNEIRKSCNSSTNK
ncbi:similar to Saccharomyces cerevisiae YLR263W RED1 Protein component of the synaptonemal complex axial elements, involved in chromosome segregation during the first meiotic division [Maudiozyma saulgeensis]|uniref:Similar to Saccharomyces cerevisiae YLR263W RED1 Protein component of the synaptonemal complex axial elements, involved in chromosome segregation during the first meiotic division n=1 Tax=Maudiozyma saulgeensis TaxID=1789683 RepID=A0A1X7QZN6_9SACH|nr:similar to Saccharomyces cerevisiae YLR263W RED1 Protein component of the synaptonemal complex axial elements, involved in chromosome segregation during the first meiotic division [Kazachstania saulgeensis]